ncbi:hypothetical protein JQR85_08095 [Stutzerimonas urumqiensis]|uniref:hypothetical protein n=1 Tax=Stutzerimonas urumqiensis TaxID=638269 RepID=UPI000EABD3A2|nr:hypothetical protein [Stutzerimonas urumqiensis]
MPRTGSSYHCYQLIEPDEQFDLFACRENRLHLVARQLELSGFGDRTLCGSLLPASPRWRDLDRSLMRDRRVCPSCRGLLSEARKGLLIPPSAW